MNPTVIAVIRYDYKSGELTYVFYIFGVDTVLFKRRKIGSSILRQNLGRGLEMGLGLTMIE